MEGGPSVVFGMLNYVGSFWIQVYVSHDLKKIFIRFYSWRFKSIHHNLASTFKLLVNGFGKLRVHDTEKIGEEFLVLAEAR